VLDAIGLPEHRKIHTETMFRRVIGRAVLSKWEYHRLMGVQAGTLKRLKKWPVKDLADWAEPDDAGDPEEPR
jgi:tRNA C32,U32 (ribose-2'-O)-methylase TrmJ